MPNNVGAVKAKLTLAVAPKVSVGTTTIAGGTVTVAAFAAAAVAFAQGERDAVTLSTLATGVVALVLTLGGRYAQAVAALLLPSARKADPALADDLADVKATLDAQTKFAEQVSGTSNFELTKTLADLVSSHIVGKGVAGRSFTPGTGIEVAFDSKVVKQLWYPKAKRSVIRGQEGGTPLAGRPKCVLHTTEGSSIAGAESAYRASGGSAPHFTISPTAVHQHIPINRSAYSLEHPTGTPETNRAGIVIQVEQVGFASQTDGWPDSYYDRVRELALWIHANAGVPLHPHGVDFTDPVRIAPGDWADYSGFCGHVHVPNNSHTDPGRGYHIGKVLL